MSDVVARKAQQKKASEALYSGRYEEAMQTLERAIAEHGSHMSLRADLAFSAYMASDMARFQLYFEKLEEEFENHHEKVMGSSKTRTLVALAKCAEELAKVDAAFSYIESAVSGLLPGDPLTFAVQAQRLRMLASFGRQSELAGPYAECVRISESNPQDAIECFHALILAESHLFGLESAWPRFLELSKKNNLQIADQRLCLFDLLEIALELNSPADQEKILAYLAENPQEGLDKFETELLALARTPANPLGAEDFYRWSRGPSPLCHLRLLALACSARESKAVRGEARGRLVVLLNALDHKTRKILSKKWRKVLAVEDSICVEVDAGQRTIRVGEKCLVMRAQAQSWELLALLAQEAESSPEKILAALGRRDTEFELESLRIKILRLNAKLMSLCGTEWVFRFGKHRVQRNADVQIRILN